MKKLLLALTITLLSTPTIFAASGQVATIKNVGCSAIDTGTRTTKVVQNNEIKKVAPVKTTRK